jgi:hypothetical protein
MPFGNGGDMFGGGQYSAPQKLNQAMNPGGMSTGGVRYTQPYPSRSDGMMPSPGGYGRQAPSYTGGSSYAPSNPMPGGMGRGIGGPMSGGSFRDWLMTNLPEIMSRSRRY